MSEPLVTLDRRDDGVALVQLRNGKVNSLSTEVLRQLEVLAGQLTDDPPGAVVVAGNDRIFAAGADISEFAGPDEARAIGARFLSALEAVAAIPRVTIAAVAGPALGGGCELALACDFRLAADTARFGQPEILLGIIPGGGGTQRLARLVGPARAKDLVLSGRQVRADDALAIGLVDEVVPADALLARSLDLAATYARGPLAAQALAKQAIDRGLDTDLATGLRLEQDLFVEVFATDDARIGVASFLENGPGQATFTGR
ncbi:enoyl-CoA hydratase/isomerase family protein [Rhabdothermincola salaria]|uniref:enoyl-CoA hydratase/isomerase family protein n=1 Tax=Rhabdothermincola salaria TaxID=2903142 RepID=UPI001E5478D4|nr:enoyl-CoA hydratase-related protein [Rhabdothermincola salaria]MCD9623745.1 enoyl-CoA hydratase-related protein [Rhabdothermincola salaria]